MENSKEKSVPKVVQGSNGANAQVAEKVNTSEKANGSKELSSHSVTFNGKLLVNPEARLNERIKIIREVTGKIASKELLEGALRDVSKFSPNGNSDLRLYISAGGEQWSTSNTVILDAVLRNLQAELKGKIEMFEKQILEMSL